MEKHNVCYTLVYGNPFMWMGDCRAPKTAVFSQKAPPRMLADIEHVQQDV